MIEEKLKYYKGQVENALHSLPMDGSPAILTEAMQYSLLSGGKRLRGCLALATCEMAGGNIADALPFAAAVEMIHAYSLIHDDLPAMDNDTMRRGKPTNHIVYGEAMAILAGDALLTHAFEVMARSAHPQAFRALGEMAQAAGIAGMLKGQALDVTLEGTSPDAQTVRQIHDGKTAALITAPVVAGLILANAGEQQITAGREYGYHLGIAFQIVDDLLDLVGDPVLMGKTLGKDQASGKITWPAAVGEEQARKDAADHIDRAVYALSPFGKKAEFLQALAISTLHRVQ